MAKIMKRKWKEIIKKKNNEENHFKEILRTFIRDYSCLLDEWRSMSL